MSHSVGQYLGNYQLLRLLGQGGFALVYLGEHRHLGTHAAIKILNTRLEQDQIALFQQEARILAQLNHPHIVRVLDYDVINGFPYLVMDYASGGTLRQRHPKGTTVPLPTVLTYAEHIASALDHAHSAKLIHRDIKPENMLINQKGQIMLSDFGVAAVAHSTKSQTMDQIAGTVAYISPEQLQGHPRTASDQYSLGVVIYEWLSGERPFVGSTGEIVSQHLMASPPPLAGRIFGITPAVEEVLFTALAKDSRKRFATTSDFVSALAQACKERKSLSRNDTFQSASNSNVSRDDIHPLPLMAVQPSPSSISPSSLRSTLETPKKRDLAPGAQLTHTPHSYAPQNMFTPQGILTPPIDHVLPSMQSASDVSTHTNVSFPGRRGRGRGLYVVMLITLVTALAGVGLGVGTFFRFPLQSAPTTSGPATSSIVGHAFFVSSGALSGSGIPSINDELLIQLHNLRNPAPGKVYYAWLLRDKDQPLTTPIPLGLLTVKQGAVSFLYPGDPQHTNLLAITSRFLITEEDAGPPPMSPAPDFSTVRYYAELSQKPDPNDTNHFSPLDHLRRLLAQDPAVVGHMDIHSNLDIWLMQQTGRILEWADSARDDENERNTQLMRPQLSRILDFLDGDSDVQMDLPAGMPSPNVAPVALLGSSASDISEPLLADYLHQVSAHLNAIAQAPETTVEQRLEIAHINADLNSVRNLLEQVHQDAKQLVNLPDKQLFSQGAMTLIDSMVMQAFYAYVGQLHPSTGEVQGGVIEIHNEIERLATFDMTAYAAK